MPRLLKQPLSALAAQHALLLGGSVSIAQTYYIRPAIIDTTHSLVPVKHGTSMPLGAHLPLLTGQTHNCVKPHAFTQGAYLASSWLVSDV